MADLIDNSKGIDAFAFTGDRKAIWHSKGQQIDESRATDIDYLQQAGGLDFSVTKVPLMYMPAGQLLTADNFSSLKIADNLMGTVRSDTGAMLGSVSDNKYNLVQPRTIVEFFRDFLSDNRLTISTLGALRGGKQIFALAKLGSDYSFIMPGNDRVDSYVRLQTSFDGSRSTSLVGTTIRQVCANTEAMIESATAGKQYVTKHSAVFNPKALQHAFGLLGEQHKLTAECWNTLAAARVSTEQAKAFFLQLLDLQDTKPEDISGKARNQLQILAVLYVNGPGSNLLSASGTAYGLLNAVTCYVDHYSSTRDTNGDGKAAARAASAMFGAGAVTKAKARNLAMEYALAA
jgi:phage/plasmid-like protein (TIGR03299 family)